MSLCSAFLISVDDLMKAALIIRTSLSWSFTKIKFEIGSTVYISPRTLSSFFRTMSHDEHTGYCVSSGPVLLAMLLLFAATCRLAKRLSSPRRTLEWLWSLMPTTIEPIRSNSIQNPANTRQPTNVPLDIGLLSDLVLWNDEWLIRSCATVSMNRGFLSLSVRSCACSTTISNGLAWLVVSNAMLLADCPFDAANQSRATSPKGLVRADPFDSSSP
mmetsp:Transcript_14727/g.41698  ORF Transcript_14727/g.41698 Transcript_14727/m.41698 type:complete len:216 (-) Transcript_14727:144-791(-)